MALALASALLPPAEALAAAMDVVAWSQRDSRWSSLYLDGSPYTMGDYGCAVTSCAMIADYFGSSKDPGELCIALGANGGLDSLGYIHWEKVPSAAGGTISYVGRYDYTSIPADLTRINAELDAGYPVVAEVRLGGSMHFVVLTGRDGSTYFINDPWYGDKTTLNARYGSPAAAIYGIRVYHGTHSSPSVPYDTNLSVTQYGTGTEAVNKFTITVKNNTSKTVTLARLKLIIDLTAPGGTVGGSTDEFTIMGENDVVIAPGATITRRWYRALPRDGTYRATVAIMVGSSWQGDSTMGTDRRKSFTVEYAPKGDFNADGDADYTVVYDGSTTDADRLMFDNFLAKVDTNQWVYARDFDWTGTAKSPTHAEKGKFIRGNFNLDGKADVLALYDDLDGTCTVRVYPSDGSVYGGGELWFSTGGWRWAASQPIAMDINGDGDDELVIMYSTNTAANHKMDAQVFSAYGDHFGYTGIFGTWNSPTHDYASDSLWTSGDVTGDGKDELLEVRDQGDHIKVSAYRLSSSGATELFSKDDIALDFDHIRLLAGDVNADGDDDVVLVSRVRESGAEGIAFIAVKSGRTFFGDPWYMLDAAGSQHYDNGKFVCGDFTGDGKADVAAFYDDLDNTSTLKLYKSTGDVFAYPGNWLFQTATYRWHRVNALDRNVHHRVYEPTPTPPAPSDGIVDFDRLEGETRYETAIAVSEQYGAGIDGVVLATGANFPDALCAAPLAHAYGGPILLVPRSGLNAALKSELERLKPSEVFVVGGTGVVPASVETFANSLSNSPEVTRLAGRTRYDTAAEIASQIKTKLGVRTTAVVTTGQNFPDALAAAPLAAANGWPILLTRATQIPDVTAQALSDSGATSSVIVGGPSVVSDGVEAGLPDPERIAGANRYETCAAIAEYACEHGSSFAYAGVATGKSFPDALAAGPLAGAKRGVLLLASDDTLPSSIEACLTSHKDSVAQIDFLGGEDVVGKPVWDRVSQLLQ